MKGAEDGKAVEKPVDDAQTHRRARALHLVDVEIFLRDREP
jgi:hypothetical protein